MRNTKAQNLKLGIFIVISLFLFIAAIYYLGKQQNLFQRVTKIYAYFDDIKGLKVGNSILFSGIHAGTVADLTIVNDSTIKVEMIINNEVTPFIKKDSKVEISNEGVIGNKIINIYPGSADFGSVEEGDRLPVRQTLNVEDVMKEAMEIVRQAKTFSEDMTLLSKKVVEGNGVLGTLINNQHLQQDLLQSVNDLKETSVRMNRIITSIDEGKGDLGKMVNNDYLTNDVDTMLAKIHSISLKLDNVSQELVQTTRQINNGQGLVTKLLYDSTLTTDVDSTLLKAGQSIDEIRSAATAIENAWIVNLFSKKDKKKDKDK
ncbi:MAG: MCE family protein [Bacteroidetes bacterium]|jgi:phospholipid/cholesterol/gamma-HCH transport system substrate-binding protein|nr:MCE family protein [Bacteroidota bacterium]